MWFGWLTNSEVFNITPAEYNIFKDFISRRYWTICWSVFCTEGSNFGEGYRGVLGVDGVEDALVADLRLGDEAACFLARLAELTDGPGLFPRRPRALGLRSRRGRFSRHLDVAGRLDEGPSRLVMLTAASAISRRAALWYEPRVFVSGRLPAPEPLSAGHGTLTVNARAAIFA